MVLAEAFMKRNDLKKQIAKLTEAASMNLWQDTSLPINFTTGTKVNPQDAYEQAMRKMSELQALNTAIAEANIVNNGYLRELETITARISLHESIMRTAELYPGDKSRDREYGVREPVIVIRENEWLINPQKVKTELQFLYDRKRELEKILAHNNFSTEVVI